MGRIRATPEAVLALVRRRRFTLADEKALQAEIGGHLEAEGYDFLREYVLGPGERPDFYFPVDDDTGFVMEAKIKGSKRRIYDQCARYCGYPRVTGLILATNVATGFPPEIHGKPCWVASLGMGWL